MIISSMARLGHIPIKVLAQLDKQAKLTFLNVPESLRLTECILDVLAKDSRRYQEFHSVLEKLFSNLLTKADKMDERKLAQALGLFLRQLQLSFDNEGKLLFNPELIERKLLQYRV